MSKVILVTGASRGIGADITQYLAKQGYIVILNYNKSEEEAKKIQSTLAEQNINIDIFKADVTNHFEVTKLVNFVLINIIKLMYLLIMPEYHKPSYLQIYQI